MTIEAKKIISLIQRKTYLTLKSHSLSENDEFELMKYVKSGIIFISTPFQN